MVFTNLRHRENVKFLFTFLISIDEEMSCSMMPFSSLKSDIIGVFAPQKLIDSTNQDFCLEASC